MYIVNERQGTMAHPAVILPRSSSLDAAMERVQRSCTTPVRTIFLTRMLNAATWLTETLGEPELSDAAAQRTDYGALLRALEAPEIVQTLMADDPLAKARLLGLESKQFLLHAEGGSVPAEEAARRLGLTRQGVDRRRRSGRLLGLTLGRRGYAYPVWQFGEMGTLPGLEKVLAALRDLGPWSQVSWFISPNTRLGGDSPLTRLRTGEVEPVVVAARAYGEQGGA